jgi:APA family basic amino acid/polyamine antiporter
MRLELRWLLLQDGLEVKTKDNEMKRVLGLFQLSAFGISAIIGGGIFVVTGIQAKNNAGWAPTMMIMLQCSEHTLCMACCSSVGAHHAAVRYSR